MNRLSRIYAAVRTDHRYVFLGTSLVAGIGLCFSQWPPTSLSFLAPSGIFQDVLWALLWLWLICALLALIYKLSHWSSYAETSPFVQPNIKRAVRYASYLVWCTSALFILDRGVEHLCAVALVSINADQNPAEFLPSLFFMTWKSKEFFIQGIEMTVSLACVGTVVAFILAILMVFLRIQQLDRSDNDLVRFFKRVGTLFARFYSTVVRGTPMMVQGLLIYYAGFSVLRVVAGMDTTEANALWTTFMAGVVTISLNSTAYMMEVLRAGIEAVDAGQAEAARSLGLSQWQAMMKVVFPQGVKNAIPALANELIINIKDSSVLSVIGIFDLMYATTTVAGVYYRQMEVYLVALVVYLCLTMIAGRLLDAAAARLHVSPTALPSSN